MTTSDTGGRAGAGTERQRFRRPSAAPTIPINFRIPPDLHAALVNRARSLDQSLNQTMVELIRAALEREGV